MVYACERSQVQIPSLLNHAYLSKKKGKGLDKNIFLKNLFDMSSFWHLEILVN